MEKWCSICNKILSKSEVNNIINFLGFECYVCKNCMEEPDLKGELNQDIEYEKGL